MALVLLAAYGWSRGGQTTVLRVEANGQEFNLAVDGRSVLRESFGAAPSGGIVLVLNPRDEIPSLPEPRGFDYIEVREAGTGRLLFREECNRAPETSGWVITSGEVDVRGGTWDAAAGELRLYLPGAFNDVTVEAGLKNVQAAEVAVRATDRDSGVFAGVRPYRLADASLSLRESGRSTSGRAFAPLQLAKPATSASMVAMTLRPLPWIAAFVVLAVALTSVLQQVDPERFGQLEKRAHVLSPFRVAVILAAAAAVVALILLRGPADGVPHVPDELSYLFQAELLASGHVSLAPSSVEQSFRWSDPTPVVIHNGRWASMYPPGHPLVLALGAFTGLTWLVPPVVGGSSVFLLFLAARRIYVPQVGLMAAFLFAVSPFFLMTASNFMSHNTTALLVVATVYTLGRFGDGKWQWAMAAGVLIGAVFATRPLTGAALMPACGLLLLTELLKTGSRVQVLRGYALVGAGGVLMLGAYLGYQWLATGDPFTVESVQGGRDAFGFGGAHSVAVGLTHEQTQLSYLLLVLHNWPASIGVGLVLLPFVLGTTNRWDWFLLIATVSLGAAYALYKVNGVMHGPRYWYELTPLLMLLTGRAVSLLRDAVASLLLVIRPGDERGQVAPRVSYLAVATPVIILALWGSGSWLFRSSGSWRAEFMPESAAALKGFNGIDGRFPEMLRAAELKNALVMVDDCGSWHCYGSTFWLNEPTLDGEVVYARYWPDRPDQAMDVFAAYPERSVYRANFRQLTLKAFTESVSEVGEVAPRASTIVLQGATVLPRPLTGGERDEIRRADLDMVESLLALHLAARGQYPEARQPQTLCLYPTDAGCALREYGTLPADPRSGWSYLYWSDGRRYAVAAGAESSALRCTEPLQNGMTPPGAGSLCRTR